jgi:hypothetical protein
MGLLSLPFDALARIGRKRVPELSEESFDAPPNFSAPEPRIGGPTSPIITAADVLAASAAPAFSAPEQRIAGPESEQFQSNPAPDIKVGQPQPQAAGIPERTNTNPRPAASVERRIGESAAAADLYNKYGATGAKQQALTDLEAASAANNNRGPQRKKGFWNWIKDAGRAGLHGLKVGGLGGGLGGLIRGAIDPQYANEAQFEERDLPRAQKQATEERIGRGADLNREQDIAQITGYLRGGVPTAVTQDRIENRARQARNDANLEKDRASRAQDREADNARLATTDRWRQEDRAESRTEKAAALRDTTAQHHVAMAQSTGQKVDPAVVKGTAYESWGGKVPPKLRAEGAGLTDYQRFEIDDRKRDNDRQRSNDAEKLRDEYEDLTQKAAEANSEATRLHNERGSAHEETTPASFLNRASGGLMGQAASKKTVGGTMGASVNAKGELVPGKIITDSDVQAAWAKRDAINNKRDALREKLRTSYGDLYEVGKDYVKPRDRAAAAGPAAEPRIAGKQTPAEYQASLDAVARYREFVKANPDKKDRARAKFMQQNPGVDPDAQ